jgi:hypothetical protein
MWCVSWRAFPRLCVVESVEVAGFVWFAIPINSFCAHQTNEKCWWAKKVQSKISSKKNSKKIKILQIFHEFSLFRKRYENVLQNANFMQPNFKKTQFGVLLYGSNMVKNMEWAPIKSELGIPWLLFHEIYVFESASKCTKVSMMEIWEIITFWKNE